MACTEEERFALLARAAHFDDEPKALEALGALDMGTICKLLASDASFAEGVVDPNSLNTLVQGMATAYFGAPTQQTFFFEDNKSSDRIHRKHVGLSMQKLSRWRAQN